MNEDEIRKLSQAYVGVVRKLGMSYNIQEEFIQQGSFSVRATPLGSNLVLLESLEEGEMEALIEDANEWLGTWFKNVRKWSPSVIDNESLTWLRCYGIPAHAWTSDFFRTNVFGTSEPTCFCTPFCFHS